MEDEDDRGDVDHRGHRLDEGGDDQLHARVALEQAQWAQHAQDAQHLVRGRRRRARARVQVRGVQVRVGARVQLRARVVVRVGVRVGVLSGEP